MTTSAEVRSHLMDALRLDLVGPTPEDQAHAEEILPSAPSKWYLSGFLVPYEAPLEQRADIMGDDELDQVGQAGPGDDEAPPEQISARRAFFPSSMTFTIVPSTALRSPSSTTVLSAVLESAVFIAAPIVCSSTATPLTKIRLSLFTVTITPGCEEASEALLDWGSCT